MEAERQRVAALRSSEKELSEARIFSEFCKAAVVQRENFVQRPL